MVLVEKLDGPLEDRFVVMVAGFKIGEQLRPEIPGFAADNRIAMLQGLVPAIGWVYAAQHHRFSTLPKFCGDLIGPRRIARHDRESDEITRRIEIHVLDRFVDEFDVPGFRRVGCNDRKAQLREPHGTPLRCRQAIWIIFRIRIDQEQPSGSRRSDSL